MLHAALILNAFRDRRRKGLSFALASAVSLAALPCMATGEAAEMTLPSGQTVTFLETLEEAETETLRLRYVAPDLASPLTRPSFEALTEDLEQICASFVQTLTEDAEQAPAQIVVSLMAEPVEFGVINTEVEQVFEAFSVENGSCILEVF